MKLSVIIPVLNEAAIINQAIDSLWPLADAMDLEIIVSDGDPDGGTLTAITTADVKKVTSPPGRGRQLNAGADVATGDMLLFLHADTRLPEQAGQDILDVWADPVDDPAVCGGAFDLSIDSPRKIFRAVEKAASWRSRVTRIPYGDQAVFIKAAVFKEMGGFRPIPIMEDIDLAQRLKHCGHHLRFIRYPVRTSARRWENEGVLYATLRNYCLSTLFYLGVSPYWLKKFYH